MQDAKNRQKVAIWAPLHNFVGLYLCNQGTYRQSEQEGQHPLTGQRAANFRLLDNQ